MKPLKSAGPNMDYVFTPLYAGHGVQENTVRDSIKGFIEIQKYHHNRLLLIK